VSGERFFAVRQARTKVIGSRSMTKGEADREVKAWREHIGPAVVVPADKPGVRHAIRTEDQAVLAQLLAEGQAP
jgi:hypothetical protein